MARTFDAGEIATLAARQVQAINSYETGLDEQRHRVALQFLDMVVSELVGTEGCEWLRPGLQEVTLTADKASYSINAQVTTALQFFHHVNLRQANGDDVPLRLLNREEWVEVEDKDQSGNPERVFIDHTGQLPTLFLHPVPATSGMTLFIDGQGYSSDVTKSKGAIAHGLPDAWQLWLVNRLAWWIGNGPLIKAPQGDRNDWKAEAMTQLSKLTSYQNRQNRGYSSATRPWMP